MGICQTCNYIIVVESLLLFPFVFLYSFETKISLCRKIVLELAIYPKLASRALLLSCCSFLHAGVTGCVDHCAGLLVYPSQEEGLSSSKACVCLHFPPQLHPHACCIHDISCWVFIFTTDIKHSKQKLQILDLLSSSFALIPENFK